ncbi:hypothetical protein K8Z61_18405 [Nocardioides sp. TRM66260-LWL]|uniref:hypothetical protein n=1 Tax=Nocardioides sp. TRM66260-LWL TaxID=2874478 RepID=UPI001CC49749|nr:hypothetical protein [Nocardioides sp. TRM66260-LWL]MBZ5736467.1 hypothetical protein [Nocardioides sp. TRM66260-LWL]
MTPEQFDLVNRATAPWLTLWLIGDFPGGRAHAVQSLAGGTWRLGERTGQYATDGNGMRAWLYDDGRDDPAVTVTWAEVGRWVATLSEANRAEARRLRAAGQQLQIDYPNTYASLGHPLAWDVPGSTPEEHERDRQLLREHAERRAVLVAEWNTRSHNHHGDVRAFLDALRPVAEQDLLDLLEAAR